MSVSNQNDEMKRWTSLGLLQFWVGCFVFESEVQLGALLIFEFELEQESELV